MRLFLNAVALRGPGLEGWQASAPILAGNATYLAAPTLIPPAILLPPNERRRAPQTVKLALAVGAEAFTSAGAEPASCPVVFASSGGDGETIHEILATLAGPVRELSPTRFHNSVHNVAAGYWSIATGAKTPATSLCAHDGSFAAGLLEAGAQALAANGMVALIAYDLPYPEPLASVRPIVAPFALALLLSPVAISQSLAQLDVELCAPSAHACTVPELEDMRRAIPTARVLPLLEALARGEAAAITLDYLDDLALAVKVTPL
ncbi:MAG: beta-ketoacyl synthase chain length factor [Proteobacteria bacterium]|nr:beta-ketoacyl synthase chain length factor [Pseudomonadota bacterium]MBU6426491.1 beta-ketoacyl synthase chain length factor [Rhodospirillales bacterium]